MVTSIANRAFLQENGCNTDMFFPIQGVLCAMRPVSSHCRYNLCQIVAAKLKDPPPPCPDTMSRDVKESYQWGDKEPYR